MTKFIVYLVLPLGIFSCSYNCNEDVALELGISAIKNKYPALYEAKKPYSLLSEATRWVVLGYTPEGILGGGAPEVTINKVTCNVGDVYFAR